MPGDIPIPDSSTEQLENCNGDVHVATNAIKAATPETAFWIRHIRSVMEPLLASTQSYTPSEQTAHLKFLDNYVAPALGSLPTEPHSKYTTPASFVGTLFEPSLNFSNKASTKARFSIDIIAPVGREGLDPFGEKKARDTLRQWASTLDADTTWLEHFVSSLQLTPGETEIVRRKIPAHINHPPACSIGCELNGASRTLKAYIPIKRKALAAGKASSSVLIDALESLETSGPDYSVSGLSTLASYLADSPDGVQVILIAFDCVNPAVQKARIKVYLRTESTDWEVARDVMTLGGRLQDDASQKRISIMQSLWPLLMGNTATHAANGKRVQFWPYTGLLYNVNLTKNNDVPETQCYIPMFSYPSTADGAHVEFERFLKHIDHEWGSNGRYREVMKNVFGSNTLYGQCFASFAYTEKNGAYMTSYFAMPIDRYLGSRVLV